MLSGSPLLDNPVAAVDDAADPSQRAVLDLPVGSSSVVIGGPGTGKTWTLIESVAGAILSGGVAPADVLVLAPNRTSATALRDILALRLGVALPGPLARTAASVASEIVRAEATARGDEVPRLLTGAEQDRLFAELLEGHIVDGVGPSWPKTLTEDIRRLSPFRTELRELLGRVHEGNIALDDLRELAARHARPEWAAAAEFFAEYYSVLDSYRGASLDSAEMIAKAVAITRAGRAVRVPKLVFVDDAQELTLGTVEMLAAWARTGAAIVAFGDPDVAVTGFRGGRADLLAGLGSRLGVDAPTLFLRGSHRVGGEVAGLLAEVTGRIGASGATGHRRPVAVEGAPSTALLRIDAPTRAEEAGRLARQLRELHVLDGVPWERMAVVLRSGRLVPSFARMLSLAGVPTRTSVAARALREEWSARSLVLAVETAIGPAFSSVPGGPSAPDGSDESDGFDGTNNPVDLDTLAESGGFEGVERAAPEMAGSPVAPPDAAFAAEAVRELLLGPVGGIDVLALRRLRLALRHEEVAAGGSRSADELIVEAVAAPGRFATIDMAAARRADRLATTLQKVREQHDAGASIEELLWTVWERSGLAAAWSAQAEGTGVLADEANHHLDSVVALFAAARRFVERSPELAPGAFLAEFLGADLPEDSLAVRPRTDSVLVCPPAAIVGAEYDIVGVAAVQDGVWPNLRLRSSLLHADQLAPASEGVPLEVLDDRKQVLADELRMFALAVSRARRLVLVSCVSSADEQPSPLVRLLPPDTPTADEAEPFTLRGLVGRLRRELAVDSDSPAASALARLAAERVPGADPTQWYGLAQASTDAPLVDLTDPDARVPVSPSRLATIEKSPLGWFIDTMGASPSGFHADLGTLVHAAMETLSTTPDAELHADAVMALIDARWHEFRFDSKWEGEYQRARARLRAEGLADYLTGFVRDGHVLAGAETPFTFELGQAIVTGKIDRIEHTADGAVVIVDLKTGSTVPRADELPEHAQLGLYQLAAAHGGIPDLPEATPGGAKLVFVASRVGGRLFRESAQEPLTPEQLEAFRDRVRSAAETMAGTVFPGVDGLDDRDPLGAYPYRIHLIPAVSA